MNGIPSVARTESRSERITRRLGLFLSRWGVDAAQYHWLLQSSLKMDFRSSGGPWAKRGGGETKSALLKTAMFNALFSGFMSIMFAFMAGSFFFSVIMIGYAMAMLAMMILVEFGLVVISPEDYLILAYRPISSRTFLAVRFSNLLFYVLILGLSLSISPAFAGLMCKDSQWYFPAVYLLVSIGANLFVAGAVIAFYGFLMRWFNYEKFKDVLVYCQIVLSFMFFFGYQLLPRMARNFHGMDINTLTHTWAAAFPSVWFAGLVELALGHWTQEALLAGAAALLVTFLLIPGLLKAISLDYSERIGQMATGSNREAEAILPGQSRTSFSGRLGRLFLKDGEERAFFCFIVTMLTRNRQLKLQLYPNFGMMIAISVLAIVDHKSAADPLSAQGNTGMASSFVGMGFVVLASALATVLPYSDEYAGAWLFQVAPVANPATILKSLKKAALLFMFLPLLLLDLILFSFFWPFTHVLEIGVYGLLMGIIGFEFLLFKFRGFPFSRKLEKGTQSRQFTTMMVIFGLMAAIFTMPFLFGRSQITVWATCVALAILCLILDGASNRRFAAKGFLAE
jgi:hypothetical protein